jgi:[NiFe] hydrogenase assembly HybE family chaperone
MHEAGARGDPCAAVRAAFAHVAATRMRGLPMLNPVLRVEAVDFCRWQGQWLGALVTPWCINLMLLPDAPQDWPRLAQGGKRAVRFPAGCFEFIAGEFEPLGEYHACSLFSPAFEFDSHEAAVLTARAARRALFEIEDVARFTLDSDPAAPAVRDAGPTPARRQFLRSVLPRA